MTVSTRSFLSALPRPDGRRNDAENWKFSRTVSVPMTTSSYIINTTQITNLSQNSIHVFVNMVYSRFAQNDKLPLENSQNTQKQSQNNITPTWTTYPTMHLKLSGGGTPSNRICPWSPLGSFLPANISKSLEKKNTIIQL